MKARIRPEIRDLGWRGVVQSWRRPTPGENDVGIEVGRGYTSI
jgi:hypothetical protein